MLGIIHFRRQRSFGFMEGDTAQHTHFEIPGTPEWPTSGFDVASSSSPRHRHYYDHHGVARYLRSWAWNRTWALGLIPSPLSSSSSSPPSSSSRSRLIRQGRPDQIGSDHTSCCAARIPTSSSTTSCQSCFLFSLFLVFFVSFFDFFFFFFFFWPSIGLFSH